MGKISEWQSRQLASSAVGVPSPDRSGEIIASGLQQGVQGVVGLLAERKKIANDLASDTHMADITMAYGEAKGKAMTLYRDRPDEFPKAVYEHGVQLVEQFTKKMQPGVAEMFKAKAMGLVTNDVANSVSWARQRDQQIIVDNIQKGYNNLEIASQQAHDPVALGNILKAIDTHSKKAQNFIDFSSDQVIRERTRKASVENALSGSILTNSSKAYDSLARGEYDEILTPLEKKTYIKMAQAARVYDANLDQYRSLAIAGGQISDMLDRQAKGELPLSEINLQLEWAKLHENDRDVNGELKISPEYIRNLEGLKEQQLKQDIRTPAQRKADSAAYAKEWEAKWGRFLQEKKDRKPSPRDFDEILGLYAQAQTAVYNGVLSPERFAGIKKIMDTSLKARAGSKNMSMSLTEALDQAATKRLGWFQDWDIKQNIYTEGYLQIGRKIGAMTYMTLADRQKLTEDLLVKYTEYLDNMPQEEKDKIKNAPAQAKKILEGSMVEGKEKQGLFDRLMVITDPKTGSVFKNRDVVRRNGALFMITGFREDGEPEGVFVGVKK